MAPEASLKGFQTAEELLPSFRAFEQLLTRQKFRRGSLRQSLPAFAKSGMKATSQSPKKDPKRRGLITSKRGAPYRENVLLRPAPVHQRAQQKQHPLRRVHALSFLEGAPMTTTRLLSPPGRGCLESLNWLPPPPIYTSPALCFSLTFASPDWWFAGSPATTNADKRLGGGRTRGLPAGEPDIYQQVIDFLRLGLLPPPFRLVASTEATAGPP